MIGFYSRLLYFIQIYVCACVRKSKLCSAQKMLAEREGIFCEPASAISLAGVLKDVESGKIPENSLVVCTLTGHGLKDPDTAIKQSTAPVVKVEATLEKVKSAILDNM